MAIDSVIFGLGHRARHGKDSVAAEIVKQRSSQYDVRVYSFAAELKDEVNQAAWIGIFQRFLNRAENADLSRLMAT